MNLIVTSSNISENYSERKNEYIESFNKIKELDFFGTVYLAEDGPNRMVDYFKDYPEFVINYTNYQFQNKGIRELFAIRDIIQKHNIKEFIKLTGRYTIVDNTLYENLDDSDFVGSLDGNLYPGNRGIHTFYFYIKSYMFLEFVDLINENNINPIEWDFKDFLEGKNAKYLEYLGIYAKPFYSRNLWKTI